MTVAVLMYHATSDDGRYGQFDVSIDMFEKQIECLACAEVNFVPFSRARDPALINSSKRHVSLTFDDGHGSNARAIEIAHRRGIRPAAFIVSDWARTGRGEHGAGYLTSPQLRDLSAICDLGCHGASHRALAELSSHDLNTELSGSKAYLQDTLGQQVIDMSIPRGESSAAVVQAALDNGYKNIGNSWFDLSRNGSPTINRLAISANRNGDFPARLVARGNLYWRARKSAKAVKRVLSTPGAHLWPLAVMDSLPIPGW